MRGMKEKIWKLIENNKEKSMKLGAVTMIIVVALLFNVIKGESQSFTIERDGAEEVAASDSQDVEMEKKDESDKQEDSSGQNVPEKVYVDIDGAVKKPGVYVLDGGSRVFEALEEAGGLIAKADTSGINQADVLQDGQKIFVPRKGESQGASAASSGSAVTGNSGQGKVNINTADSTLLQTINGVGPATAEKIITYREQNGGFKVLEDLKNVSGIGDKTFEKLKDQVTI